MNRSRRWKVVLSSRSRVKSSAMSPRWVPYGPFENDRIGSPSSLQSAVGSGIPPPAPPCPPSPCPPEPPAREVAAEELLAPPAPTEELTPVLVLDVAASPPEEQAAANSNVKSGRMSKGRKLRMERCMRPSIEAPPRSQT